MKKYFLMAVTLGMALMLTACSGNTGTDASDDIADMQADVQADADIQDEIEAEEEIVETDVLIELAEETEPEEMSEVEEETGEQTEMKMNVQVGDYTFTATLEDNVAVEEFLDMMKEGPVTVSMNDYSGFEKVGSLGRSLTASDEQTTTSAGDIVLYNDNNIVMFYGSNSWSYTRIGKIDDLSDWKKALGSGSITAVFTVAE